MQATLGLMLKTSVSAYGNLIFLPSKH